MTLPFNVYILSDLYFAYFYMFIKPSICETKNIFSPGE
jgi:hypothetical protein